MTSIDEGETPDSGRLGELARQIRRDSVRMIVNAGSGHPGGALGIAEIMALLVWRGIAPAREGRGRRRSGSARVEQRPYLRRPVRGDGEGMKRVYENDKWMVGLKNWKPANDLGKFDGIERHRETDELFVLVEDPRTGSSNSDTRRLAPGELAAAKEVVAKAP